MNHEGPVNTTLPLMIGIGGRSVDILSTLDLGDDSDLLILDTDARTEKRFPDMKTITVGRNIVNGEGSGGNMNLARACFKMGMEDIAPLILGRPLVVVAASTVGATGIAGAVEICSLLTKVGLPSFSFLLHEETEGGGGMDPLKIASILLDGPLRPGCILVRGGSQGSTEKDPFGLSSTLPYILSGAGNGSDFPLQPLSWSSLREDGGPFEIGPINIPSNTGRIDLLVPALVSLRVPSELTTEEVRTIIESAFGHFEALDMALITTPGIDEIHGAYISKATRKLPIPEGSPIDQEALKEIIGGPLEMEIEPDLNIP